MFSCPERLLVLQKVLRELTKWAVCFSSSFFFWQTSLFPHDGFNTNKCHFTRSCAPAHHFFLTILSKQCMLILKIWLCFGRHSFCTYAQLSGHVAVKISICKYGHRPVSHCQLDERLTDQGTLQVLRHCLLCFVWRVNATSSMAGKIMSTLFLGILKLRHKSIRMPRKYVQMGQRLRLRFRKRTPVLTIWKVPTLYLSIGYSSELNLKHGSNRGLMPFVLCFDVEMITIHPSVYLSI